MSEASIQYPKLRPVEAIAIPDGRVCLRDPQGFSDKLVFLPAPTFFIVSRFDSSFSLGYLHSVARLPCVETFRSTPGGGLELIRTSYKGLGAGLPFSEEGGVLHLENGWIVLEGLSRRFPRITVQPASFTDHHLIVGGWKYLLDGLTGGGPAVLSIERRSFLRRLAPDGRIRYIKP